MNIIVSAAYAAITNGAATTPPIATARLFPTWLRLPRPCTASCWSRSFIEPRFLGSERGTSAWYATRWDERGSRTRTSAANGATLYACRGAFHHRGSRTSCAGHAAHSSGGFVAAAPIVDSYRPWSACDRTCAPASCAPCVCGPRSHERSCSSSRPWQSLLPARAEIRRTGVQLVSRPRCGGYDDVVDVASGAARVEEAPAGPCLHVADLGPPQSGRP